MSDLIRREDAIKTARLMIGLTADERENEIRAIPIAEPTINDIAERISNTEWYHIFKGELRHGAHDREEALFKAEDIFNVLKDMGASEEYTDQEMEGETMKLISSGEIRSRVIKAIKGEEFCGGEKCLFYHECVADKRDTDCEEFIAELLEKGFRRDDEHNFERD